MEQRKAVVISNTSDDLEDYDPKEKKETFQREHAYFISFILILCYMLFRLQLTSDSEAMNNSVQNSNNNLIADDVLMNLIEDSETFSSEEGTRNYIKRFSYLPKRHFRKTKTNLFLSSVGIGTYLGDPTNKVDKQVSQAIMKVVQEGINVIDTAINYRGQKGERSVGRAVQKLLKAGFNRNELFISTKAGFMPKDADRQWNSKKVIADWSTHFNFKSEHVLDDKHCIHPSCLQASLKTSLKNLQLNHIDLLYLHNAAEKQLMVHSKADFYEQLRQAFQYLEHARKKKLINYYGMATSKNFCVMPNDRLHTNLQDIITIAEKVGGVKHGFRHVQLPLNMIRHDAFTLKSQRVNGYDNPMSFLEAAHALGITIMTSRSINGGDILDDFDEDCFFQDDTNDINGEFAKMIQLTRSFPGVTTALVGMKSLEHIDENLQVNEAEPLELNVMKKCFKRFKKHIKRRNYK